MRGGRAQVLFPRKGDAKTEMSGGQPDPDGQRFTKIQIATSLAASRSLHTSRSPGVISTLLTGLRS